MLAVHESFCEGFARRDAAAVIALFASDPGIVVVTSGDSVLEGPEELRGFLLRYAEGQVAYSWEWETRSATLGADDAWVLAQGTEIATSETGEARHPYRMTMGMRKQGGEWLLMQVHGSSPEGA